MRREAFVGIGTGLACLCAAAAMWCFFNLATVSLSEQRAAQVLAQAGPKGAAAYSAAWADGRLTRNDMRELREEAGRDIDAWIAAPHPPGVR
ncbi:hypothetical protein KZ820_17865 [Sphingomonas sp. RRHST34]|uniref:Uncharacterized protein n=1 Tax=Sphingomonas citri TaxID=2862499 RepID=A0ABS7BSN3_9SPHN|nr:hypothetical protein [Sphingomonas citri]MBW6532612.1 hypothetical protein [Sphingomonas citri]